MCGVDEQYCRVPSLPSSAECGWKWIDERWTEIRMMNLPAPEAIISLGKCNCDLSKCRNNICSCRKANVNCTQLCRYVADEEERENHATEVLNDIEELDENDDDIEFINEYITLVNKLYPLIFLCFFQLSFC